MGNHGAFEGLKEFLPPGSLDAVMEIINQYKVILTVTGRRESKLGDYRIKYADRRHRISINHNLNPYEFLITLLHEFAHMITMDKHGPRVDPHGAEWKFEFKLVSQVFLGKGFFPPEVETEFVRSLRNPAASCGPEHGLQRVLKKYDRLPEGVKHLADIADGHHFIYKRRIYLRITKIRTRIECIDCYSRTVYLFQPMCLVMSHTPKWLA